VIARLGSCQGSLPRLQLSSRRSLRYLVRNGPMLSHWPRPFILLAFFHPSGSKALAQFGMPADLAPIMFPLAASLVLLGFMNLAFNSFAYDGHGLQLLLVAPIRLRDVLLAKNLLQDAHRRP